MFIAHYDRAFSSLKSIAKRKDDDWSDKINHLYTVAILVVCALVVTMGQYVGDRRIECWTPAHFSGTWDGYTNDYCWVQNTYRISWEDSLPRPDPDRDYVVYYQWIPFYLFLQAFMFFIPIMLWRTYNVRSGINLNAIVLIARRYQSCESLDGVDKQSKEDLIDETIVSRIKRFLRYTRDKDEDGNDLTVRDQARADFPGKFLILCGRKYSNYLTLLYIFIKFIAITNVIGQMFLLSVFLGSNYFYGVSAVWDFMEGTIHESVRFPRVTFCDIPIRRLGNMQTYTVQCVLPINLFHEMIFLLVWFWFLAVAIIAVINLASWIQKLTKSDRLNFVAKQLQYKSTRVGDNFYDDPKCADFVYEYLRHDGAFILRMIYENTDILTASEVTLSLWEDYCGIRKDNKAGRRESQLSKQDTVRRMSKAALPFAGNRP